MPKLISKISLRTTLYIFIGSLLFLYFINFVQFPTSSVDINLLESNLSKMDSITEEGVLNEINSSWFSNLGAYIPHFKFLDYISQKSNAVISSIYILTFFAFITEVILLSLSNYYKELREFWSEKTLDTLFLYASEWAINAPPVLGVVGTIFSFGIVVSSISDMSSLSTVFKENFANAALTTIIGGSVYVINLFINIFVAKNLSK